jgi:hypothetical protein
MRVELHLTRGFDPVRIRHEADRGFCTILRMPGRKGRSASGVDTQASIPCGHVDENSLGRENSDILECRS